MSTWRDIWRYGVIANRFYSENEEKGETAFAKLKEVYDKPEKEEFDGMIRYIMAESYELKYHQTNNYEYQDKALDNYEEAAKLFPVKHWKKVANDSFNRLNEDIRLQDFYKIRIERKPEINITADFKDLLWYGFHKVYTFTHLNDFARYVSLSALARGSSEWPLSLVDFRTVLELEIKQCFPEVIEEFNDENRYSLRVAIDRLYETNKIDEYRKKAFHDIRMAGNIAAHELYPDTKFKYQNLNNFITVLRFLNEYRYNHLNKKSKKLIPYPLCQLSLPDFLLIPWLLSLSTGCSAAC